MAKKLSADQIATIARALHKADLSWGDFGKLSDVEKWHYIQRADELINLIEATGFTIWEDSNDRSDGGNPPGHSPP